jgi:molecular chaperone GrpE (heat shock protein)
METDGHSMENCPFREKIENNHDRSKENERQIKNLLKNDWYTNKELFKMIQSLTSQLTEFNGKFKKYNGLVAKYQNHEDRLEKMEESKTEKSGAKKAKDKLMDNIAWIIAVVSSMATFVLAMSQLGVI